MRILVNALSATSLAGRHVVEGLVRHVAGGTPGRCRWLIVSPGASFSHLARLHADVEVREGPHPSTHWARRTLWEARHVRAIAGRWGADCVVSYSGVRLPGVRVPQVCIACNPRPLVRVPFWEPEQGVKHRLQRALYRWSSDGASLTVFNSEHLRSLYLRNGMSSGSRTVTVPHGLSEDVFAASASPPAMGERGAYDVVSTSVWSRYKGAETLVEAVGILRGRRGVPARLTLAGPWPEPRYERGVRRLVARLGLTDAVRIPGFLPRPALLAAYARARVFCLPSFTESFGIPALEAQAFGTPVVGSSTTAMAEVCGEGGVYCEPGHPDALAEHLRSVLEDHGRWEALSHAARANAQRYRWERCVAPLVGLLESYAEEPAKAGPPEARLPEASPQGGKAPRVREGMRPRT